MKIDKLRRKAVVIPTIAVLALGGVGATVWSATAQDDVTGADRDRVAAAAVEAAGGGEAVDVESSDDPGQAYEVEVRKDDGTEVDVELDEDLNVLSQEADDADDADDSDDAADDRDDATDDATPDADDRVLSEEERRSAEEAALDAVGGGTVQQVEASDDAGEAYEVDVRADDVDWDVTLDADFQVLSKTRD
ncbi:hypothetical protein EXE58_09050 [Nocardioides seonyuensis]|uniref:PepSY domain-containing protein n=1 Tax=Nocardioides seonyuensis TaxID=2518371 RepID=A0A4P7IED3_9ACTN|nr:PepSY domain-containing protein [Nocardioides seonyuensis]QBX55585.1 hypothetical protein EXE58_09050 [Nocardioides seonyuensis]